MGDCGRGMMGDWGGRVREGEGAALWRLVGVHGAEEVPCSMPEVVRTCPLYTGRAAQGPVLCLLGSCQTVVAPYRHAVTRQAPPAVPHLR